MPYLFFVPVFQTFFSNHCYGTMLLAEASEPHASPGFLLLEIHCNPHDNQMVLCFTHRRLICTFISPR